MKNTMFKCHTLIIICICFIISGCATKSSSTDISKATLENPLYIPLTQSGLTVYIKSKNTTHAKEDIDGLLLALLQSEYAMNMANNVNDADYVIELTIENFANIGTVDTPIDAVDVAVPTLVGAASGAEIGSAIGDDEGALIGVGIGAAAGLGIGMLAADSEQFVWQMLVDVVIEDNEGETFTTRVSAQAQGEDMNAMEAAQALENEVAWSIVRSFKKNN